jgi:hypothetical protein
MTVYKIKRLYQSITQILKEKLKNQKGDMKQIIGKKEVRNKSTYKLLSFRISKYSTVKLDYKPSDIEFCDPYVILTYNDCQNNQEEDGDQSSHF